MAFFSPKPQPKPKPSLRRCGEKGCVCEQMKSLPLNKQAAKKATVKIGGRK